MSDPPAAKRARLNEAAVSLTDDEIKVIKIQFEKDTSFPRFDDLLQEYCRFLELKLANPDKLLAPSYLIDKLWHAHILATKEYLAFCQRHNKGEYLHHDPTMRRGQERYKLLWEEYEKLYDKKPDDGRIWPKHVGEIVVKDETDQAIKQETQVKQEGGAQVKQEGDVNVLEEEGSEGETANSENESVGSDEEYDSDEREAQKQYLENYGDERGRTQKELAVWHKIAIMDPANNEGFDPHEIANCGNGHQWVKGEFSLGCGDCLVSSEGLGAFTCG